MPNTAQSIWSQVGLPGNVSDAGWNEGGKPSLKEGLSIGNPTPIFQKITDDQIKQYAVQAS
jgi:methionyl-tRNA synthetase